MCRRRNVTAIRYAVLNDRVRTRVGSGAIVFLLRERRFGSAADAVSDTPVRFENWIPSPHLVVPSATPGPTSLLPLDHAAAVTVR